MSQTVPKLSQKRGWKKVAQTVPTGRVIKYPKKCALFPPPGRSRPGRLPGVAGGCQKCTQLAPPKGGFLIYNICLGLPKWVDFGGVFGAHFGAPGRLPGASPGGPARPGPARPGPGNFPGKFSRPGPARPGSLPGGWSGRLILGGSGGGSRTPFFGPIITVPTGDALRMLRAMHRLFPPSIA